MISLVIPFLDAFDKLAPVIEHAIKHAKSTDWELVLIDNGSQIDFDITPYEGKVNISVVKNLQNTGVLPTYKQGFELARGDIVAFIHSDVLIHGDRWVARIKRAFREDKKLGLAGFFGARGIGVDGGRSYSMSNMLGKEWGGCECHPNAAWHHGEPMPVPVMPATVLDGVALIFRRSTLYEMIEKTDAFADWRAPHHFYDKILSLKTIGLGYHVAVIDIEFDHWSGATANHSKTYDKTMRQWAKQHGYYLKGENGDRMVYLAAEQQMFDEYQKHFPVNVWGEYDYRWTNL